MMKGLHTINKNVTKNIGYFTIFFLVILSLFKINSHALGIKENVYVGT